MGDPTGPGTGPGSVVVLSRGWGAGDERAFVVRSLAGALTRHAPVEVLVPGHRGLPYPDGAFDVAAPAGPAPEPARLDPAVVLVGGNDQETQAAARRLAPRAKIVAILHDGHEPTAVRTTDGLLSVGLLDQPAERTFPVGLHIAVHHRVQERPHDGVDPGSTLLVLGGEPADTSTVAWLTAAFPRLHVTLVADGNATAWSRRRRQRSMPVPTRTDLWRHMAHALATIDLHPGGLVARECVESLRLGTPVVVPKGTPIADAGPTHGVLAHRDTDGLLGCVGTVLDETARRALAEDGRRRADDWYGDSRRFVERVGVALRAIAGDRAKPLKAVGSERRRG